MIAFSRAAPWRWLTRCVAAFVLCLPLAGWPQAYPTKPVLIKIGYPAGGPTDVSVRAANVVLQRNLGQTVVAENVPGANGSIAVATILRAEPEGYALLGTSGVDFLLAPVMVASARYEPESFRLLGVVGISDFILVATPTLGINNVAELIAYARKPGQRQLSIAHWGTGSAPHLVGADFQTRAGISLLEVPYKGAAPTMTDVASGQVDLTFIPLAGAMLNMIQSGKLKPIGLAGDRRNPALPSVPTLGEHASLKGFEHTVWSGLLAPPRTPEVVVTRLTEAMNEWIASPENLARITANASRRLEPMTATQNAAFLKSEHDKYRRLARTLKLEPQ